MKGELFDETEERLKLTQVENGVMKRQLQVLQQKMLEGGSGGSHGGGSGDTPRPSPFFDSRGTASPAGTVERNSSFMYSVFDRSNNTEGGNTSINDVDVEDLKENIAQLEVRNSELSSKLRQSEIERMEQNRAERERIQQLVNEFDNVRKELDEEIKKYEMEKMKMKEKIQKLEQQKLESDKLKGKIRQWNKLHCLLAPRLSATASDSTDETEIDKAIEKMHHSMFSQGPLEENSEEELKRSASFPTLLVTSADSDSDVLSETGKQGEKSETLNETKMLQDELVRLKAKVEQSIRRTVSQHSAASGASGATANSLSPSLTKAEPSPAFAEFSTDLGQVQAELEKLLESMVVQPPESTISVSVPEKHEILMENEELKKDFVELKANYEEAARELDMYRNETAAAVLDRKTNPRFPRSNSAENLINASVTPEELQR